MEWKLFLLIVVHFLWKFNLRKLSLTFRLLCYHDSYCRLIDKEVNKVSNTKDFFCQFMSENSETTVECTKSYPERTIHWQQESPPAWTQEAYCPLHSKCVSCWWGGVYPIQSWWGGTPSSHGEGLPHSVMVGGIPHPVMVGEGYPGYPPPSRPGRGAPWVPPTIKTWDGVPPTIQTWDGVPPAIQTWDGVPSTIKPGMGTPLPSRPGMGYPPTIRPGMGYPPPSRPGMGYPPTNGEQTDIPKYKYYLPSYYVRGR